MGEREGRQESSIYRVHGEGKGDGQGHIKGSDGEQMGAVDMGE